MDFIGQAQNRLISYRFNEHHRYLGTCELIVYTLTILQMCNTRAELSKNCAVMWRQIVEHRGQAKLVFYENPHTSVYKIN